MSRLAQVAKVICFDSEFICSNSWACLLAWSADPVAWSVAPIAPTLAETVPRDLTSEVARGVLLSCLGALKGYPRGDLGRFRFFLISSLKACFDLCQTVRL
jgi:hypothetical protein